MKETSQLAFQIRKSGNIWDIVIEIIATDVFVTLVVKLDNNIYISTLVNINSLHIFNNV